MTAERLAYWRLKFTALAQLVLQRREAALAVFSAMRERWPHDAYVLGSRSHLNARLGRSAEALADAQALTAAHPLRGAADWFNLAFLLDEAGRPEDAEPAFRQALALDQRLDRAWYGLGLALIRLRRLDEAVVAFKRNTELQPMSPYGWYQMARVQLDRRQPAEARRIVRHLQGFEPRVAAQLEREIGAAQCS